jgi:hypothetical protein
MADGSLGSMLPRHRSAAIAAGRRLSLALVVCLLAGARCSTISTSAPPPTPADFQGIASLLLRGGLRFDHVVSGDAGCDDQTLARTAIALDASGLDQTTPTRLYIYIFRNRDSFERLRQTVDACARSYVTNPDAFESIEASPFVVTGPGPWGAAFRSAVRMIFSQAAGSGD